MADCVLSLEPGMQNLLAEVFVLALARPEVAPGRAADFRRRGRDLVRRAHRDSPPSIGNAISSTLESSLALRRWPGSILGVWPQAAARSGRTMARKHDRTRSRGGDGRNLLPPIISPAAQIEIKRVMPVRVPGFRRRDKASGDISRLEAAQSELSGGLETSSERNARTCQGASRRRRWRPGPGASPQTC